MARMADIRRVPQKKSSRRSRIKPAKQKIIMAMPVKHNQVLVNTIKISIKCMEGCGNGVNVVVDVLDIVPKYGRPRGMRVRCHTCLAKYSVYG